jgi:hypothetical protein
VARPWPTSIEREENPAFAVPPADADGPSNSLSISSGAISRHPRRKEKETFRHSPLQNVHWSGQQDLNYSSCQPSADRRGGPPDRSRFATAVDQTDARNRFNLFLNLDGCNLLAEHLDLPNLRGVSIGLMQAILCALWMADRPALHRRSRLLPRVF